jgi:RND family efflux transporter MFP subunit
LLPDIGKNFFSATRRTMSFPIFSDLRRYNCAVFFAFACFVFLSAAPVFAAVMGQAGAYRVSLVTDPPLVPVGKAQLIITVSDLSGAPVEGAHLSTLTKMPGMTMGERAQDALPHPKRPGVYVAPAAFSMAGSYTVEITINGANGPTLLSLALSTGQDTEQTSASWTMWWLLAGGVLLIAFVFYRMKITGQRLAVRSALNKQVGGALFLFVLVTAFSLYAIKNWRRPGAMTPIEAQAMDMTMPAPEGVTTVELATVTRGSVQSTVRYTGQAVGFVEQEVNPRITGLIESMPFYVGDHVRRGQVLARLDTSEYEPQIAAAGAAVNAAQQSVREARAQHAEAMAETMRAQAEIGVKRGVVAEAKENRNQDVSNVSAAHSALREARSLSQKAAAEVIAKRKTLDEVRSGESRAGATLRQERSDLKIARATAAQARSDIEAARQERVAALAQSDAAETGIAQSQADLQAATADLEYWRQEIARTKTLVEQGVVSREEYQRKSAQAQNAEAKVQSAQSRVTASKATAQAAQAAGRRAMAMLDSAQARERGARAAVESSLARIAQAQTDVTASHARSQQATANIQMAQADLKSALARADQARARVLSAQTQVSAAEARITQSRAAQTAQQAATQGARAAERSASARVGVAQAGVGKSRAELFAAVTRRGYTEIRSQVDGVVTQRLISPGVLVQPGQAILKVAQVQPIRVQANVAQSDLTKIEVGSRVVVRSRADAKHMVAARVTSIAPALDPASRTGVVEAILSNAGKQFSPGQYVQMEITTGQSSNALRVPSRAIGWHDTDADGVLAAQTQQAFVWVAQAVEGEDGLFTVQQVDVEIGESDGRNTAIRANLQVGQKVVLGVQSGLRSGDRVATPSTTAAPSTQKITAPSPRGIQTATITVTEKGFTPATVELRAHTLTRLTFLRKTEATCATDVVLPEFDIKKKLPLNRPVVVEIKPRKAGDLVFGCGMDLMLRGKLVVR